MVKHSALCGVARAGQDGGSNHALNAAVSELHRRRAMLNVDAADLIDGEELAEGGIARLSACPTLFEWPSSTPVAYSLRVHPLPNYLTGKPIRHPADDELDAYI